MDAVVHMLSHIQGSWRYEVRYIHILHGLEVGKMLFVTQRISKVLGTRVGGLARGAESRGDPSLELVLAQVH